MKENSIYFVKLFAAKNIQKVFEENPMFQKKVNTMEYSTFTINLEQSLSLDIVMSDNGTRLAVFSEAQICVLNKDYAFLVTKYKYPFNQESAEGLEYAIDCHICPEGEYDVLEYTVAEQIFKTYKEDNKITIAGSMVDGKINYTEYNLVDFDTYDKSLYDSNVDFFLFTFDTNLCFNSDIVNQLKNIATGLPFNEGYLADIPLLPLEENVNALIGSAGCGLLIKDSSQSVSEHTILKRYMEGLKECFYIQQKVQQANKLLDKSVREIKNLDYMMSDIYKNVREAAKYRNKVKNNGNKFYPEDIFYNGLMTSGIPAILLNDFEETSTALRDEFNIESERRRDSRSDILNKILGIIGIFAIVSAFKDGSDLNIEFFKALQGTHAGEIIRFISVVSPIICIVFIIVILIKLFKNK